MDIPVLAMRALMFCILGFSYLVAPLSAQDKVPLDRCDVLPIIPVRINGKEMKFLLDTGATTILNIKSFDSGRSKDLQISSWAGTAATSAKEILIAELAVGNHRLRKVRLPAVDLSPIGKACGGQIDGLLGVDLLERMGATIDLKRRVARFDASTDPTATERLSGYSAAMSQCLDAFNHARTEELKECFDSEIVLYTPWGEFKGRERVLQYLKRRFLSSDPLPRFEFTTHDLRIVGEAVWQSYDYRIQFTDLLITGRGMMISRENNGHWQLLNMHNSIIQPTPSH
jgi:predicted aspartyl protease